MDRFIDVEKILKDKNPGAYKWIPGFLISYLKRVIHQDDLNEFQARAQHKKGLEYCAATVERLKLKVNITGLENIPKTGGFILASNHPLGGLDGIALINEVGKVRGDIRFLVNDILTRLVGFAELFVPVNKVGSTSLENLRRIEEIYASEHAVLIFPAGLVSRKNNGVIKDLDWHKSFITKSIKYNKAVIPVHISGQLSSWFYGLSKVRRALGIKANIEMLYLADELFSLEGTTMHITIGKPISAQTFSTEKTPAVWANEIREFVYELPNNSTNEFRS
jgi:putative hemolysin